jgi:hypothetical protein
MKRNGMKNLSRLLAVLPLRACPELAEGVRGSQRELRTLPPSTDSRLPAVFICHSDFGIWTWSAIWALAFELCLPFASLRQSANPRSSQSNGQIDETNRVYFNNRIGRLTYGRELLNSRKNSNFYKTNHPGFPASVRQPSPLVKTNGKPTKRIIPTLTTE